MSMLPISTQLNAISLAFPDACKTPPTGAPVPYGNVATSMSRITTNYRVYVEAAPAHNTLTLGTISSGDEAGAMTGMVSNQIISSERPIVSFSKVFIEGGQSAHMCNLTTQNGTPPNMVGSTLVSVSRVLV